MADPAKFGHDRIGHLLEDQLLTVPEFQRSYAWDETNVDQYLDDLAKARHSDREYFMGTVVLAEADSGLRKIIVDGQQRLATTAVLMIAIRDRLSELQHDADADAVNSRFLRRYEISQKEEVTRLVLSPDDLPDYDALVEGRVADLSTSLLAQAYLRCKAYVDELVPEASDVEPPWDGWRLSTLETRMERCHERSLRGSRRRVGTRIVRRIRRCVWCVSYARSWVPSLGRCSVSRTSSATEWSLFGRGCVNATSPTALSGRTPCGFVSSRQRTRI
jgi:hypothetical protein